MAVNAHGRPLCRHSRRRSARPEWRRRTPGYPAHCNLWCEWRTCVYWILIPAVVLIAVLFVLVPHSMMFGFQ